MQGRIEWSVLLTGIEDPLPTKIDAKYFQLSKKVLRIPSIKWRCAIASKSIYHPSLPGSFGDITLNISESIVA